MSLPFPPPSRQEKFGESGGNEKKKDDGMTKNTQRNPTFSIGVL